MPANSLYARIKHALIGETRNPLDPNIFHTLALTAFLAWVGLGADGLSSSCYGPEEAFHALGAHRYLALYLSAAIAITIFVISTSYSQLIEFFPSGGGGYLVASKLLGSKIGLVSGTALVVDYVLTIAVSMASGTDAIFSFLPLDFQPYKLMVTIFLTLFLILLNLKGVKESIQFLLPIFMVFLLTHMVVVFYGIFRHAGDLPNLIVTTKDKTLTDIQTLGFFPVLYIFMRAFSLGGGTFTGIEAVSNGMQALKEPRAQTGRRAMLFMSISLAFMAGGITLSYLLNQIYPKAGQTLNATLVQDLINSWKLGSNYLGYAFWLIILLSEGALLFVAAQSGFVDGPRVLANMAVDNWVPRQFSHLSERLVIKNGIYIMGLSSIAILLIARGKVSFLIVLYSINVFVTFSLSQLGMCLHWWQVRHRDKRWSKKIGINFIGLITTASILIVTLSIKFFEGGWLTILLTGSFVIVCLMIRKHYEGVECCLRSLDDILLSLPTPKMPAERPSHDTQAPTAVLLVSAYSGLGVHSFLSIQKLFPNYYKNFIFISAGVVDSSRFKGVEELAQLQKSVETMLLQYVNLATRFGFHAEFRCRFGIDRLDELEALCQDVVKEFPRAVFFAGKLIFQQENWLNRFLHNQAALATQRRLQYQGLQMVILPIRAVVRETSS
jgi:amino acid transporter